jgi:uncharacterized protein YlxP (DUF503 family)
MVVSILHFVLDLPDVTSLKEKRQVVQSVKRYSQIAAAVVSNSRRFGETVMQKVLAFAEREVPGRIRDAGIFSEHY